MAHRIFALIGCRDILEFFLVWGQGRLSFMDGTAITSTMVIRQEYLYN
ncbi:MAG: hypothetical protein ACK4HB_00770 [Candidatus Bipolaricaulia bacterium]